MNKITIEIQMDIKRVSQITSGPLDLQNLLCKASVPYQSSKVFPASSPTQILQLLGLDDKIKTQRQVVVTQLDAFFSCLSLCLLACTEIIYYRPLSSLK